MTGVPTLSSSRCGGKPENLMGEKWEVGEAWFGCVRTRGMGRVVKVKVRNFEGGGDFGVGVVRLQTCLTEILGFLEKFGGGFEQDIDEQDKKKKRSGEDDEESKICYGLNNGGDEKRWKSMALSEKGARSGLSKQKNASLKL
ncbi:hypothetical protein Tco_1161554 [Tanacetum coccineum]